MAIEISIISDIHHGRDLATKKASAANALFKQFVKWHQAQGGSVVVDLGDKITASSETEDLANLEQVRQWYSEISEDKYFLLGNMERKFLSNQQNNQAFGYNFDTSCVEYPQFNLVFWNPDTKIHSENGFVLNQADLDLLDKALSGNRPTILFTHIPLDGGSFTGNYYFEKLAAKHATYSAPDASRIRKVLEKHENLILCINGHAHWNTYHCVDGIHYFTVPSLVELFPTFPEISSSWSKLTVSENSINLKVLGNLPIEYNLPYQFPRRHWLAPEIKY